MKAGATPRFDAHPADADDKRHQHSRHVHGQRHIPAICDSNPQNVDGRSTALPSFQEVESTPPMQNGTSCGHGRSSVSQMQACNVLPPPLFITEQISLNYDYNQMQLAYVENQFLLQQLYIEQQRSLAFSRYIEASEQKERSLLHSVGLDDVETLARDYLRLKNAFGQRLKQHREMVMEYQKKCLELSAKVDELEHLHAQKAMADSGSYRDSAATPSLLQAAADQVHDAIVVCASELFLRLKKTPNIDLSKFVPHVIGTSIHDQRISPSNLVKVALQALLSRVLFNGFGDIYFSLHKDYSQFSPFEIPSKRKTQLFASFKSYHDREAGQLLNEDSNFKHFVHAKVQETKLQLLDEMENGELNDLDLLKSGKNDNLDHKFLRLAKAMWVLHRLAMAFEPSAEVFHVGNGSPFDEKFMQDDATHVDEDAEEHKSDMVNNMEADHKLVRFMCVPGFTLRHTVIKSRVFCLPAGMRHDMQQAMQRPACMCI